MSWKDLQFIKQVIIKPEDPENRMYLEFREDCEAQGWEGYDHRIMTSRDRRIQLGANAMYEIHMDYPEDFKKLVAATGDTDEAFRLYQMLRRPVPNNWESYVEEKVW